MFNYGMQPLFYSPEVARRDGLGWLRLGHDICYYQNHFAKVREREEKNPTVKCYTASWAFTAKDTGHCGYVSISLLSEYQISVHVDLDWITFTYTNGICLFYRCFSGVFHTGVHTCSRPVLVLNNLHTYVYVETHTTSPLSSTGTGPTVTRIPTHTCSGCSGRSRASRTSTTGHVYWQGRSFVRPWPVTP